MSSAQTLKVQFRNDLIETLGIVFNVEEDEEVKSRRMRRNNDIKMFQRKECLPEMDEDNNDGSVGDDVIINNDNDDNDNNNNNDDDDGDDDVDVDDDDDDDTDNNSNDGDGDGDEGNEGDNTTKTRAPNISIASKRRQKKKAAEKKRKRGKTLFQEREMQRKHGKNKDGSYNKNSNNNNFNENDDDDDEENEDEIFEEFLKENQAENESNDANLQNSEWKNEIDQSNNIDSQGTRVLAIKKQHLNPENEMRRAFGSSVVDNNQPANRRDHRFRQALRRTYLTSLKGNWPKFTNPGIFMEVVTTKNEYTIFRLRHNDAYSKMQRRFFQSVESLNPDNIAAIIQRMPYHVDALLQLSEIFLMQGDNQNAADFVERALYALEASFSIRFNLVSGTCRLPYRFYENRAVFIGLYRSLSTLRDKGCWRTGLEVCKLLLSFDDSDPVGCLLMLDLYSIMCREYDFLDHLYDLWHEKKALDLLPNFAYSMALIYFFKEQQQEENNPTLEGIKDAQNVKSNIQLQKALLLFPSVIIPLAEKVGLSLPPSIYTHRYFQPKSAEALAAKRQQSILTLESLYINRSHFMWKFPEIGSWLNANILAAISKVDKNDPLCLKYQNELNTAYTGYGSLTVYRHVLMSGIREVISTLPPSITQIQYRSFDPIPPENSVNSYSDQTSFVEASAASNVQMFLSSLLPSFSVENAREMVAEAQGAGAGTGWEGMNLAPLLDVLNQMIDNEENVEQEQE